MWTGLPRTTAGDMLWHLDASKVKFSLCQLSSSSDQSTLGLTFFVTCVTCRGDGRGGATGDDRSALLLVIVTEHVVKLGLLAPPREAVLGFVTWPTIPKLQSKINFLTTGNFKLNKSPDFPEPQWSILVSYTSKKSVKHDFLYQDPDDCTFWLPCRTRTSCFLLLKHVICQMKWIVYKVFCGRVSALRPSC